MADRKVIRWGLLGAGMILDRWLMGALQVQDAPIAAIASRTRETAERMAGKWHIPRVMTYDEMIGSPEIDAVYIPVPHPFHRDLALRAMEHGKHVLVEKPACVTAADFELLSDCAMRHGVFLMEAMWTRFFPAIDFVRGEIARGTIGEVRAVHADFSYRTEGLNRSTDAAYAGGGLLDVGVYCLHFARMILGKDPVKLTGLAAMDTDDMHLKVDEQASMIAMYDRGELASMSCGVRTDMPSVGHIYGTKGSMTLPRFWSPTQVLIRCGGTETIHDFPVEQNGSSLKDEGFRYEFEHVNDCIREGIMESPVMDHAATLAVLRQCDTLRREWGLIYPFEL